jgi:H(+)-translocating pyrophosphatase
MYATNEDGSVKYQQMFECIAGYGLGGSTVALFGRVGGGIYTKAADVGADLAGKILVGLPEDDPSNPGVIADNVGDNVGDIAGMGSDLFGSLAESTCAALVVSATSKELMSQGYIYFPLMVTATGILVSIVTALFAQGWCCKIKKFTDVEGMIKWQLVISTILMIPTVILTAHFCLPATFEFESFATTVTNTGIAVCIISGLVSGFIIGISTEYFTSNTHSPVIQVSEACKTGAAVSIIQGLALGYMSTVIPVLCLAVTIYLSFQLAGMYGISMAALGMLSNLCIALAIDGYGPISDNAGGIAEMSTLNYTRERTDCLDAAGNTTAAIGKGFAIGSAALVALALFGAFATRAHLSTIDVLKPLEFSGLVVGAMLPYAFTALTMKAVGTAAGLMIEEIKQQWTDGLIAAGTPDYDRCIAISTQASINEMILPGLLVILTPIVTGVLFGAKGVAGVLAGSIVSGIQMAISQSNTGGAWDNSKKYIEAGRLEDEGEVSHKKGSETHKNAVIGDTVGDPLKDTSGPSINILIKLMAIISLVFGDFFSNAGYLVA